MTNCANCGDELGYDVEWDDPPKGDGHIKIKWNPEEEPAFVCSEAFFYCCVDCLTTDSDNIPSTLGGDR
jgi:hypothetical protein